MQKNVIVCYSFKKKIFKAIPLRMKLITILIFVGTMTLSASSYSQATKINLQISDSSSLKDIFSSIEKASEFIFVYDANVLNTDVKRIVSASGERIETILDKLFRGTDVAYLIDDRQVFLYQKDDLKTLDLLKSNLKPELQQRQKTITGTVVGPDNVPLPGVTVFVKGTTVGTLTDIDGKYTLSLPANAQTIVFSFVGMQSQEISIGTGNVYNITLSTSLKELEEVVVVGYGTQKKESVTGAIASIKADVILSSATANTSNSLAGRLPGLTTIQTTGKPGYDIASIYIRGVSTFGTATAIFIVDGIERTSGIGGIDPNEIETINILKDASATAVYGIKGANGVVVVTTKRGFEGKPRITLTSNYGIQTQTGIPDICNAYDAAMLKNEALKNDGLAPWFDDAELQKFKDHSDPVWYPDVNWFKELANKYYPQTSHNINFQGGTRIVKYFVSAGYTYQDGMSKNIPNDRGISTVNTFKRYNIRTNLDLNLSKNLTVGINLGGQIAKTYNPGNGTIDYILARVVETPAFAFPVKIPGVGFATSLLVGNNLHNPIGRLAYFTQIENNKLETSINLNYKLDWIIKGLSYRTTFAYDSYFDLTLQSNASTREYNILDRKTHQISVNSVFAEDTYAYSMTQTFGGTTKFDMHTGFDYVNSFGNNNFTGILLVNRQLIQLASADAVNAMQGVVGRITYDYAKKYFAEFNASYNGSENFVASKRYGFFPAISLGYSLHKTLLKNVPWIDVLKLRGSYGLVGNDRIGQRFLYLNDYSVTAGGAQFGDLNSLTSYPIIYHSRIGNPDVTWEKGTKRDIGLESSFFKGKINLTADIFDEMRRNILVASPQSRLTQYGESYPAINVGKVYNKGYEIEVSYKDIIGPVEVGLNVQVAYSKNKILNIDEPPGSPDYQKKAGHSVGQFQGYLTDGFYKDSLDIANSPVNTLGTPIPGDLKYKDYNQDGKITTDDMVFIGYNSVPEYNFSFSPTISWKGFTLDILFQGVTNVSSNLRFTEQNAGNNFFNFMLSERWTPATAETATWPALHSMPNNFISYKTNDYLLSDASFLKLRNTQISWQVPAQWISRFKVSALQIYINGQNLHTWTKFKYGLDPEMAATNGYPLSRIYNVGIRLQF